jgi:hypothetical protein
MFAKEIGDTRFLRRPVSDANPDALQSLGKVAFGPRKSIQPRFEEGADFGARLLVAKGAADKR